jgi:hypothetical protein
MASSIDTWPSRQNQQRQHVAHIAESRAARRCKITIDAYSSVDPEQEHLKIFAGR